MREKRFKRYMEKIERIQRRLKSITAWSDAFLHQEKERLAVYKAFQEIAEAAMDIIAMMAKDSNIIPEDDYTNLKKLGAEQLISKEVKNALSEVNGLRNRILHEYNGLDHKIALESMRKITPLNTKICGRGESVASKTKLKDMFTFLQDDVLGVLLYGSHVKGNSTPRSDIDICIVLGRRGKEPIKDILQKVWRRIPSEQHQLDIKVFEELPLHLKVDIIHHHELLLSKAKLDLYEYFYQYRKRWNDQKHRQHLTKEEQKHLLSTGQRDSKK